MPEDTRQGESTTAERRPWLGLRSYGRQDRHLFFGRTREIEELRWRIRGASLTVLYGESGRGKSSLLAAGLLPVLEEDGYAPLIIRLAYDATAPRLIDQIASALTECLEASDATRRDGPLSARDGDANSLWEYVHGNPRVLDQLAARRPVIIVDQFEEVFTLGRSAQTARSRKVEVTELLEQLADLVENRVPTHLREALTREPGALDAFDTAAVPLSFVLTLREDYLGELEVHSLAMPSLMRNRVRLNELSGPSAMQAVLQPGRTGAHARSQQPLVAELVAARIVRFVAKRSEEHPIESIEAVPPLLSLVCFELNEARIAANLPAITDELVTRQTQDILHSFYERSFAGMPTAVRVMVEDRLLTREGGHRDAFAREDAIAELRRAGVTDPDVQIERLIAGRLINSEERRGFQQLELTHDVLAPIAMQSRSQRSARLRSEQLARERRRLGVVAVVLAVICVGLGWGALYTLRLRHSVERTAALQQVQSANELISVPTARSQALASLAKAMDSGAVTLSESDGEALRSVLGLAPNFSAARPLPAFGALVEQTLASSPRPITTANWSPSGRFYLLADESGRLGIWETRSNTLLVSTTLAGGCAVRDAKFLADESSVIAGTSNGEVWRVRIDNDRAPESLHKFIKQAPPRREDESIRQRPANSVDSRARAGNPTVANQVEKTAVDATSGSQQPERAIATSSPNKSAICTPRMVVIAVSALNNRFAAGLSGDAENATTEGVRAWSDKGETVDLPVTNVLSLEFAPDGEHLLAMTSTGKLNVYGSPRGVVGPPQHEIDLKIHKDAIAGIARYSRDGQWIAAGDDEGQLSLIHAPSGRTITKRDDFLPVSDLSFGPDEKWLAVSSSMGRSDFVSVPSLERIVEDLSGGVSISADGQSTVLREGDTARIGLTWDSDNSHTLAHGSDITAATFAPDGRSLLTATSDGRGRIWQVPFFVGPQASFLRKNAVGTVSYSRDSTVVAVGFRDGSAQVLSGSSALPVSPRVWVDGAVTSVALSRDKAWFAVASHRGPVQIWSVENGSKRFNDAARNAPSAAARTLAFRSDGLQILAATEEGAYVWDLESNAWARLSPSGVSRAEYSPDEKNVTLVTEQGTLESIQIAGAQTTHSETPAPGEAELTVTFSQDRKLVLASSSSRTELYRLPDLEMVASLDVTGVDDTAISVDDTSIAIAGTNGVSILRAPFSGDPQQISQDIPISKVGFASNSIVMTVDRDNTFRLVSTETGKRLATLSLGQEDIDGWIRSPDSRRLLVVTGGKGSVFPIDTLLPGELSPLTNVLSTLAGTSDSMLTLGEAIGSISDSDLANSLRYRLLSDPASHPLLVHDGTRITADELYARLPLDSATLQHWWTQTRSDLLLARWVLATAKQQVVSDRKWRHDVFARLSGSEDVRIRSDLELASFFDRASGEILIRDQWTPIEGSVLSQVAKSPIHLPKLGGAGLREASTLPGRDLQQFRVPALPLVSPVHIKFLPTSSDRKVNEALKLLTEGVPTEKQARELREALDLAFQNGDQLAGYLLSRLLDTRYGGDPDVAKAVELMRAVADAGSAAAQNGVGWDNAFRPDWPDNHAVANEYFSRAASQGHPFGIENLGVLAKDVDDDRARAFDYLSLALESVPDDAVGHLHLAQLLELGGGTVKRDLSAAMDHYRQASGQNNVEATYAFATRLEFGLIDRPDRIRAKTLYRRIVAIGGNDSDAETVARAEFRLGYLAEKDASKAEAATWYHLAASGGHVAAHYALARLLLSSPALAPNYQEEVTALLRRLQKASRKDLNWTGDHIELSWIAGEMQALVDTANLRPLPTMFKSMCPFSGDETCDAPSLCTREGDREDCIEGPATRKFCPYENDGQCDVPRFCPVGTDRNDCTGHS